MKEYLIYQVVVEDRKWKNDGTYTTTLNCIIRRVKANSKEEAIGKFVVGTKDIEVSQKLDVMCDLLEDYKVIE